MDMKTFTVLLDAGSHEFWVCPKMMHHSSLIPRSSQLFKMAVGRSWGIPLIGALLIWYVNLHRSTWLWRQKKSWIHNTFGAGRCAGGGGRILCKRERGAHRIFWKEPLNSNEGAIAEYKAHYEQ